MSTLKLLLDNLVNYGRMVALTGQWWLDTRSRPKAEVTAHLVNLAWGGLSGMQVPVLRSTRRSTSLDGGR